MVVPVNIAGPVSKSGGAMEPPAPPLLSDISSSAYVRSNVAERKVLMAPSLPFINASSHISQYNCSFLVESHSLAYLIVSFAIRLKGHEDDIWKSWKFYEMSFLWTMFQLLTKFNDITSVIGADMSRGQPPLFC